jgi:antiviral helicase SKI2
MVEPGELESIIKQIVDPIHEDADRLLQEIGLATIPSREQIHQEIEAKLLSPPDTLPDHWLSTYQMYGYPWSDCPELTVLSTDTGKPSHPYHHYFHFNLHHHPQA